MPKNKKKIIFTSKFHSIRKTFGTYIIMCIGILVQIMLDSYNFHVDEANNTTFRTPMSLKTHKKKCPKTRKNHFYMKLSFHKDNF